MQTVGILLSNLAYRTNPGLYCTVTIRDRTNGRNFVKLKKTKEAKAMASGSFRQSVCIVALFVFSIPASAQETPAANVATAPRAAGMGSGGRPTPRRSAASQAATRAIA